MNSVVKKNSSLATSGIHHRGHWVTQSSFNSPADKETKKTPWNSVNSVVKLVTSVAPLLWMTLLALTINYQLSTINYQLLWRKNSGRKYCTSSSPCSPPSPPPWAPPRAWSSENAKMPDNLRKPEKNTTFASYRHFFWKYHPPPSTHSRKLFLPLHTRKKQKKENLYIIILLSQVQSSVVRGVKGVITQLRSVRS